MARVSYIRAIVGSGSPKRDGNLNSSDAENSFTLALISFPNI